MSNFDCPMCNGVKLLITNFVFFFNFRRSGYASSVEKNKNCWAKRVNGCSAVLTPSWTSPKHNKRHPISGRNWRERTRPPKRRTYRSRGQAACYGGSTRSRNLGRPLANGTSSSTRKTRGSIKESWKDWWERTRILYQGGMFEIYVYFLCLTSSFSKNSYITLF